MIEWFRKLYSKIITGKNLNHSAAQLKNLKDIIKIDF